MSTTNSHGLTNISSLHILPDDIDFNISKAIEKKCKLKIGTVHSRITTQKQASMQEDNPADKQDLPP